jgi:secreted trypsin-like serine protease
MFSLIFFAGVVVATGLGALPDCGKTPIPPDESRIVGGKIAIAYSWPWQVEMCMDYGWGSCDLRCGGTIIDEQWIMSAAHCVDGYEDQAASFGIKVGTFDYNDNNETGEVVFNVSQIFKNPQYGSPHQFSHDISLLKLSGKITFTNHIQPVCVPKNVTDLVHKGKSAWVTGWGATSEDGPVSDKLRQVHVPFLEMSACTKEYGSSEIDDTMECAGKQGVDSCQGDSGGPLVTKHNDGRWFQAGIVSWGQGCAEKGYAGVYSRPSANCDFIKKTIGYDICQ